MVPKASGDPSAGLPAAWTTPEAASDVPGGPGWRPQRRFAGADGRSFAAPSGQLLGNSALLSNISAPLGRKGSPKGGSEVSPAHTRPRRVPGPPRGSGGGDRKSTRLNSSHVS